MGRLELKEWTKDSSVRVLRSVFCAASDDSAHLVQSHQNLQQLSPDVQLRSEISLWFGAGPESRAEVMFGDAAHYSSEQFQVKLQPRLPVSLDRWALGTSTAQVKWLVVQTNPSLQLQPAPHQALHVALTAGFLKADLF